MRQKDKHPKKLYSFQKYSLVQFYYRTNYLISHVKTLTLSLAKHTLIASYFENLFIKEVYLKKYKIIILTILYAALNH